MKQQYIKTIKWITLGLLIVSLLVSLYGWICGFESNGGVAIDVMFYWCYALVAVALIAMIVIAGVIAFKNDKKFLVKAIAIVGGAAVLCAVVYLLSPGAPAVGMAQQPDDKTLKLTDTILNLTYVIGAATILALIVGEIYSGIRNKREAK